MKQAILFILSFLSLQPAASAQSLEEQKARLAPYMEKVAEQKDWLYSRLQMYWSSHATDVYIYNEDFDHVDGLRAPVATVRLDGCRGIIATHTRPSLEDVVPYDDDGESNVTFINMATGAKEKVHPAKTGTNINSINKQICSLASTAAEVYRATGDTAYASLAFGVMDTYLKGIYYRNVPIDMARGHMQTLVGMQTFEVIHEDCIASLCNIYDILGGMAADASFGEEFEANVSLYEAALKKWADNIIDNGVPHNNWNLFQAKFIADVALVLRDDDGYADGKGRQHYLNQILDEDTIRQWSIGRLCDFGYDGETGIWYESPGYSVTVMENFASFANMLDERAGIDLFERLPILLKTVRAAAEYLFPNRMIVGFGDTHPTYLSDVGVDNVISYARRHGKQELADEFTALKEAIRPDAENGKIERLTSRNFHAPNVSWALLRTGMDPQRDLMASLNASLGNHQHANGISLELYGKGYVLAPDGGIGKNLYSGGDYKEYYSQFPAHNTVCVDGISGYPVMMSSHAFRLEEIDDDHVAVGFREPETQADQQRVVGVRKVAVLGGDYYVDIFRSRRSAGGDKTHDYFYHNLGQEMQVCAADGDTLDMTPTEQLAFAGGHLYAYSYIYDKRCAEMEGDIRASFTTRIDSVSAPEQYLATGGEITMNAWVMQSDDRKIIRALSPVNLEYERMPNQPYDIARQPVLTLIVRQRGEAWNRPFVCVYEPTSKAEPSCIRSVEFFRPASDDPSAVGICVTLKDGRKDYIFSSADGSKMEYEGMTAEGRYILIGKQ